MEDKGLEKVRVNQDAPHMISPISRLLPMLAIFMMACAQVFGLQRGFVCDCGGEQEVTQADHCHGPHSMACHEQEKEAPCSKPLDHESEGTTHQHQALIENLIAQRLGNDHVLVPEPITTWFALPVVELLGFASQHEAVRRSLFLRKELDQIPVWPVMLAHTIELRI